MASGIFRKLKAKAFRIFEATVWNSNTRAESKEKQDLFGRAYLGEAPANYDSCVLGGLAASPVASTMNTVVAEGSAFIFDNAIVGGLGGDSQYAFCVLEASATVTHDAADPTNPRIDIVYATPLKADAPGATADVKKHPLDGGGVEIGLATQEGCTVTLGILKGTAAATPAAPSVAALDGIPLAAVYIPATETDASNFTYRDRRPRRRHDFGTPADAPLKWFGVPDDTGFLAHVGDYKAAVAGEHPLGYLYANGRANFVLGWNDSEALPYWFRDTNGLTGKGFGGSVYPVTLQGGPTQWVTYAVRIGTDEHVSAGSGHGTDYDWEATGYGTHVTHLNASNVSPTGSFMVPGSTRGQQVEGAKVTYQNFVAFATGKLECRLMYWDESAASAINLIDTGTHATGWQPLTTGARTTDTLALDLSLLPTDVLEDGDFIVLEVRVDFDAGDTAAEIFLWSLRLKWGEGRA